MDARMEQRTEGNGDGGDDDDTCMGLGLLRGRIHLTEANGL